MTTKNPSLDPSSPSEITPPASLWRRVLNRIRALLDLSSLRDVSLPARLKSGVRFTIAALRRVIEALHPVRLFFSSILSWTGVSILFFSVVALALGKLGWILAHSGVRGVILVWDHWILGLYSTIEFHHIWWIVLPGLILLLLLFTRPWQLHRDGGWRRGFAAMLVFYILLYTLFLVFSWQFQHFIDDSRWFLVVACFMACHFLAIFGLGIFSSIANRIPTLNRKYIRWTEDAIETERGSFRRLFKASVYGVFAKRISGVLFDAAPGRLLARFGESERGRKIHENARKYFMGAFHVLSFAWLFDRMFGRPYYVMHFDMVVHDMLKQKRERAWKTLIEKRVHGALTGCARPGLFVAAEEDEEIGKGAGR